MKITLSQSEIENAVKTYMEGIITLKEGSEMICDFTSGRGNSGISVEITIENKAPVMPVQATFPSAPVMEPEEEEISSQDEAEPANNSVHSLFGNLN